MWNIEFKQRNAHDGGVGGRDIKKVAGMFWTEKNRIDKN